LPAPPRSEAGGEAKLEGAETAKPPKYGDFIAALSAKDDLTGKMLNGTPAVMSANALKFYCDNPTRKSVTQKYISLIQQAAREVYGQDVSVEIILGTPPELAAPPSAEPEKEGAKLDGFLGRLQAAGIKVRIEE
jgi:hypothetical protein